MNPKLFLLAPAWVLIPQLVAAEDFESYSGNVALQQAWQEFDAGNPVPETVELGKLNGNAMLLRSTKDYSLVWKEIRIPEGMDAAGLKLTVRGGRANPGDAVLTILIRADKNGAELARKVVSLNSEETQTVTLPAEKLAGRDRVALLLMLNKTGGTATAVIDDIVFAEKKRVKIDGFDRVADSAELRREWPEFDAGNPAPEKQELVVAKGKPAMRCITGNRAYAVLKHRVTTPSSGAESITIRLSGAPGNAKSGVIVFGARRNENEANFAQMQIVPPETPGEFTLNSPEFAGLETFLIVLSFHKLAGQFDTVVEEVAIDCLQ